MTIYRKNILVIILAIAGFILSIAYGYFFRNFIQQPDFKLIDSQYKLLSEGVKTERYSVTRLFKNSYRDNLSKPYYFSSRKNIIFIKHDEDKRKQSFYKLDSLGNVADSITFNNDYSTILCGDYILQNTAYSSWILDGDTTTKKYIELSASVDWPEDKVEEEFSRLNQKATDVFYFKFDRLWKYDDPNRNREIDKAIFLINGKWVALYGKKLYVNLDNLPDTQLPNLVPDSKAFDKPNSIVYVADYQKINRVKENNWYGFAYINLFYKTDTIKIKAKLFQNEKPKNDQGKYPTYNFGYYQPKNLPYLLLYEDDVYYIIKPKNSNEN